MTDDELKALVARNAEQIERNAELIERNAQAINRLEKKTEALDRQLSLLSKQVQLLVDSQVRNEDRLTALERGLQGLYDVMQTLAREQSDRSELIDRQIQALIDERRRS